LSDLLEGRTDPPAERSLEVRELGDVIGAATGPLNGAPSVLIAYTRLGSGPLRSTGRVPACSIFVESWAKRVSVWSRRASSTPWIPRISSRVRYPKTMSAARPPTMASPIQRDEPGEEPCIGDSPF